MKNPVKMFADYMVEYYTAKAQSLLLRYGRKTAGRSVRYNNFQLSRDMWAKRGGVL